MGFGLDVEKLLVIGFIAVLLIGPERLPHYAEQFAKLVRRGGEMLRDTKSRVQEEMGPEVTDVDWRKLDPRQYDPRRIIRDALFEDTAPDVAAPAAVAAAPKASPIDPVVPKATPAFTRSSPPPFDPEAT
ncbi:Sec-independent protein translocase TatB [Microbacterium sp. NPDC056234]|uniref:Sec-independent protein translocase TatB n=1 Tax=Microbacterium sp. NPDC056234 TaxID=3345757 RepID=UPI0035DCA200